MNIFFRESSMGLARSRTLVIFMAIGLLVCLAQAIGMSPARADTPLLAPQTCDSNSYCMNDWYNGGFGNSVKVFQLQNSPNENIELIQIDGRCGGTVTSNCPFTDRRIDSLFYGDPVVEIKDAAKTNLCVSAGNNGSAVLGSCPVNGYNGSPGNIYVWDTSTPTATDYLISNYYTNSADSAKCVGSSDYDGATLDLNTGYGSATCGVWDLP